MSTSTDEQVEKLGLADLDLSELPRLELVMRNATQEIIADVEAPLTALIVSPLNRVLYLEAACSSDSAAHALMGSVSDPRGAPEFRFYAPGTSEYTELLPPEAALVNNVRLVVPGWSRHLHHVAMLDRSGDLLLAQDDATLWQKLRERMTCPTLTEWGRVVMPKIYDSGLLLACESFGIPAGFKSYILDSKAQAIFDAVIERHMRSIGGISAGMKVQ